MDYDELRKLIGLCNRRYSNDLDFVGLFHFHISRFFKDNPGFIFRFHQLINGFRDGKESFQLLKFLSEHYQIKIVEGIKEYSVGAEGMCCYTENMIWVSNFSSTTNRIEKAFQNMEINLFHEILHIIIHKTGHENKNKEQFVNSLVPWIHDYYKSNVEAI